MLVKAGDFASAEKAALAHPMERGHTLGLTNTVGLTQPVEKQIR